MSRACRTRQNVRNAYKALAGKAKSKESIWKTGLGREDIIKMDLTELSCKHLKRLIL
jgi:hypothetical protein